MKTYLCWSLPDGSRERGDEIRAASSDAAAVTFAELLFHESEGDWMGGDVMTLEMDQACQGAKEPVRHATDVDVHDLGVTVRADRRA